MPVGRSRWLVIGLLAAGLPALTSMLTAAFAFGTGDKIALIMGGTRAQGGSAPDGTPTDDFVTGVFSRYIDPVKPFSPGSRYFRGSPPHR